MSPASGHMAVARGRVRVDVLRGDGTRDGISGRGVSSVFYSPMHSLRVTYEV